MTKMLVLFKEPYDFDIDKSKNKENILFLAAYAVNIIRVENEYHSLLFEKYSILLKKHANCLRSMSNVHNFHL